MVVKGLLCSLGLGSLFIGWGVLAWHPDTLRAAIAMP
jgi:hypothetical protein